MLRVRSFSHGIYFQITQKKKFQEDYVRLSGALKGPEKSVSLSEYPTLKWSFSVGKEVNGTVKIQGRAFWVYAIHAITSGIINNFLNFFLDTVYRKFHSSSTG